MLYSGVMWFDEQCRRYYRKFEVPHPGYGTDGFPLYLDDDLYEERILVNLVKNEFKSKIMWIFGQRFDHFTNSDVWAMFDFDQEKQELR